MVWAIRLTKPEGNSCWFFSPDLGYNLLERPCVCFVPQTWKNGQTYEITMFSLFPQKWISCAYALERHRTWNLSIEKNASTSLCREVLHNSYSAQKLQLTLWLILVHLNFCPLLVLRGPQQEILWSRPTGPTWHSYLFDPTSIGSRDHQEYQATSIDDRWLNGLQWWNTIRWIDKIHVRDTSSYEYLYIDSII